MLLLLLAAAAVGDGDDEEVLAGGVAWQRQQQRQGSEYPWSSILHVSSPETQNKYYTSALLNNINH